MEKVYMVCDYTDSKASSIDGTPNIGHDIEPVEVDDP
jgi:hypothetical protein